MRRTSEVISCALALCIMLSPSSGHANQDPTTSDMPVQATQQTSDQLRQLVAPIALYPDALVAQILAAATYPDQVVEADRWVQQRSDVQGEQLAGQVDKESWDPSVKALTAFPSVLANMDKNLSWTSSLGDAYVNQETDVMNSIQDLRHRADQAGNLTSSTEQQVTRQGNTIVIEPPSSDVVYVPQFNPWIVYGAPLPPWPGWYGYPGLFWTGPGIGFGLGFGIGVFGGFGWGWHHWDADWHHHALVFNHGTYISHSRTIINRRTVVRRGTSGGHGAFAGPRFRGAGVGHGPGPARIGGHQWGGIHGGPPRSGAFGGFTHGGLASGWGARGRASFGGGFHGGGFHGGGFHGGGGRR